VQAVIWIDADRDGVCDSGDLLRSVELSRGASALELTYEGVVEPNTLTQPQLCAWF
jgi:hypothetical protein